MQYIQQMNPGYNREQVVSLKSPSGTMIRFDGIETGAELSLHNMKNELQSYAGIVNVSLCSADITNINSSQGSADWDGRTEGFIPNHAMMGVDDHYLQTLGLELVEGRWFEKGIKADESNYILNETAVHEWNIREPYIGQRFSYAGIEGRVIGIVKDFHHKSLHEKIGPLIFVNMWHNMIVFKTQAGQSTQAIQSAKKIWTDFFPNDPFEFAFLDDTFNNLYKDDIKTSQLILLFSILAIVIALSGLFGLATFAVERRTKEIGIRKVFGASSSSIVHLLTREFIVLVAVAVAIAAFTCSHGNL